MFNRYANGVAVKQPTALAQPFEFREAVAVIEQATLFECSQSTLIPAGFQHERGRQIVEQLGYQQEPLLAIGQLQDSDESVTPAARRRSAFPRP